MIGPENSCQFINQSHSKLKPIAADLRFPLQRVVRLFFLWVLIVLCDVFLCYDWLLWLLWVWSYDNQSKHTLEGDPQGECFASTTMNTGGIWKSYVWSAYQGMKNLMRHIFRHESNKPGKSSTATAARNVIGWAKDIADALEYIHRQGIVHRDLKLENILVS